MDIHTAAAALQICRTKWLNCRDIATVGTLIHQREADGYFNATAMCQACGKRLNHYDENDGTKEFSRVLSTETGIPVSELIQKVKGVTPGLQGTWVHPRVAMQRNRMVTHLASRPTIAYYIGTPAVAHAASIERPDAGCKRGAFLRRWLLPEQIATNPPSPPMFVYDPRKPRLIGGLEGGPSENTSFVSVVFQLVI